MQCLCSRLFFLVYAAPRDLHSFPTRRSSDLRPPRRTGGRSGEGAAGRAGGWRRDGAGRDDGWLTASTFASSGRGDRKSTRLNSSHANISYAVFCLKKKKLDKHRWDGG